MSGPVTQQAMSTGTGRKRKAKFRVGQVMRVKATGAQVRLILPKNPNEEQVLIDKNGYVYVEPVALIDDWYRIDDLEPSR